MFFEGRIIFLYTLKKLREKFLSNWFVGYLMLKQTMNFCDSSPHLNPYYISNTVFPLCSCVLLVFCVSVWIAPVMIFCPPKNEHFCETIILTLLFQSNIDWKNRDNTVLEYDTFYQSRCLWMMWSHLSQNLFYFYMILLKWGYKQNCINFHGFWI